MIKTEKGYFYKKSCFNCGKEFLGNVKSRFCSISCSSEFRYKNSCYTLKCKNCGISFKGHNPRQFYCQTCLKSLLVRVCERCGKKFTVANSKINRKFCSKYCSKKYYFNEDVFENVKTFEQAYWIGFLMGDGHIRFDKSRNIREVILGLGKKDYSHIISFCEFLGFKNDKPLKFDKKRNAFILRIASKKLVSDLGILGFPLKDKTNNASVLNFGDDFLRQGFFLGLFDADGSAFTSGKVFYISLCGTYEVCISFCDFLKVNRKYIKKLSSKNLYELKLGRQKKDVVYDLYKKLYDKAPIFLERKKRKFEEFLNL